MSIDGWVALNDAENRNKRAKIFLEKYCIKMMASGNLKYKKAHEAECRDYAKSKTNLTLLKARLQLEQGVRDDRKLKNDLRDMPLDRR